MANKSKHICIFNNWNPLIGGVKTAVLELAKGLKKEGHIITFTYNTTGRNYSGKTLMQYSDYGDVIHIEPSTVLDFDICIIASNSKLPEGIKAKKYLQWIHTDYNRCNDGKGLELERNPQVTDYIGVSEHVSKVARKKFGVKVHTIHNIIDGDYTKELEEGPVKFVTVARIGPGKGFERMSIFAKKLTQEGIDFSWDIYGDGDKKYENKAKAWFRPYHKVSFKGVSLNVKREVANSDYLVQLSDYEGYPYTVLESLVLGTPVLITDYPGSEEIIQDGVNGYILPMDAEKITAKKIKEIVSNIPEFIHKQTGTIKKWEKLF